MLNLLHQRSTAKMNVYNSTLENLERNKWEDPGFSSHLVTECHRLRKIPLSQFTNENIRIMIGQGFSLQHLVPIALEKLAENPFISGDFYPGDLLQTILGIEWAFWEKHSDLFEALQDIMTTVESQVELSEKELLPAWQNYFR